MDQKFNVAVRAAERRNHESHHVDSERVIRLLHLRNHPAPNRRVPNDPSSLRGFAAASFELRLDQQKQVATFTDELGESWSDDPERDEGQVGDNDIDRFTDIAGSDIPYVGPLTDIDTVIAAKALMDLAVTDIDGYHRPRTTLEHHVGKAAGGRPSIQGPPAGHFNLKTVEGALKLESAPTNKWAWLGQQLNRLSG